MAFIEKSGSKYVVKQGNNGKVLSRHSSRAEAEERVAKLHKKYNPSAANRGGKAKSNQGSAARAKKGKS